MSVETAGDSANGYHSATLPTIRTSCGAANAEGLDGTQPALRSAALRVLAGI